MATDPKSVSVEKLKSVFKEGATPNEKDYHALIDLAAVGSRALGGNDNIPPKLSPGMGLQMEKGQLAVKVKKDAGVTLDGGGVSVNVDGKTVTVTPSGVGIKVKANGGLEHTPSGLGVKTGPGLKIKNDSLEIQLAEKSGLTANKGLAVQVESGNGLEIDATTGLKVKLQAGKDNYIESTNAGLAITQQGIDKIKDALKSVSLEALDAAVKRTSHGYKLDSNNPAVGDVEAKIAAQLNAAYAEGWQLTQARAELFGALKTFRQQNSGKFVQAATIAPSSVPNKTGLYAKDGVEFGAGTVHGIWINTYGVTGVKDPWTQKEDGVYALLGKVDSQGKPGKDGGFFTAIAIMVTCVKGSLTVLGHWDLSDATGWGDGQHGCWSARAPYDEVAKFVADEKWKAEAVKLRFEVTAEARKAKEKLKRAMFTAPDATAKLDGKVITINTTTTEDRRVFSLQLNVSVSEVKWSNFGPNWLANTGRLWYEIKPMEIQVQGVELPQFVGNIHPVSSSNDDKLYIHANRRSDQTSFDTKVKTIRISGDDNNIWLEAVELDGITTDAFKEESRFDGVGSYLRFDGPSASIACRATFDMWGKTINLCVMLVK